MILVVVILEKVYPIFEFVAFEEVDVETETVLPTTVGGVGVAFDMNVVAENNFDTAENIPDPAAAVDVVVGPAAGAAVSYYSS